MSSPSKSITTMTTEQMESAIFNRLKKHDINFYCPKYNRIHDVYNLFQYDKIDLSIHNTEYYHYVAMFYQYKKDLDNAEKYYLLALNKDPSNSYMLNDMGSFYYSFKKNNKKAIQYWTMSIEHENSYSMYNMGKYYFDQNDIQNGLYYFHMAIDYGNKCTMYEMGVYYFHLNDYDNVKKYWTMAAERIHTSAAFDLSNYYFHIEKNTQKSLEYWQLGNKFCNKSLPRFKSALFQSISV